MENRSHSPKASLPGEITAILFDIGGTLRQTTAVSPAEKSRIFRKIMERLNTKVPEGAFFDLLASRAKAYKDWSEAAREELNEGDLWTQWMLPDWPPEQVREIAVELNELYRSALGMRTVSLESREVILELYRRGYRLGVVSNTTSSVEVPALLNGLELAGCFDAVVLSVVFGRRKPDPAILLEAVSRMGVQPEQCVYIGNRPDRDVAGARGAGFASAIILRSASAQLTVDGDSTFAPDLAIDSLNELLALFPALKPKPPASLQRASLSTMWGLKNFPTLVDFFEFCRRAGFEGIELNHKVTPDMLAGIDLGQYPVTSIHEPCPARISVDELKKRDWLISSTDEEHRRQGVKSVQASIDLAHELGSPKIVIHAGQLLPQALMDMKLEKKLRALLTAGQAGSPEYRGILEQMVRLRSSLAAPGFAAVRQSLLELLDYASKYNICLGLENRYHYLEYPSPDELDLLLSLADPEQLGFIYDSGHDQALYRLGFYPLDAWLPRFSGRIMGTHLHDVVGISDHYAPGLGKIDFHRVAAHLPKTAFRTLELHPQNTPEQVKAGLRYLADHGCVETLDMHKE